MDSSHPTQQQQPPQPPPQAQPPPPQPPQPQQQQPPPQQPQQQQPPPPPPPTQQQLYPAPPPPQQQMYPTQGGYPPQPHHYHPQQPRYPPQYPPHYGTYHNYYPPPPPPHSAQMPPHHAAVAAPPPHGPQPPPPHHGPGPPPPPQVTGQPPPPPQQQQQQLYPQQQQVYAPQAPYQPQYQQPPRYPPQYSPHYGTYPGYYPPPPPHHGAPPPHHGPPTQGPPPGPGQPPPPPPQQQQPMYPQQQQVYNPQGSYQPQYQQPPRYPPQYSSHYGPYPGYYAPPPPPPTHHVPPTQGPPPSQAPGPPPQQQQQPPPPPPQIQHHQPPPPQIQHHQPPPPQIQHHQPPPPQMQHHPPPPPPPQMQHHQPPPQQMQHHPPPPPQMQHHQPPPPQIQLHQQPPQIRPPHLQPPPQIEPHQHPPLQIQHHQHPPPTPSRNSTPISVNITFPKNSVEATKATPVKKRKFTSKDVTDVEAWRLLMCLKSGLLAESSWAIDVLSILLNDDSTLMYFGLQHMPGLLEAVLEHFKCCLNELFDGMVSDTTLKPVLVENQEESSCELVFKTVGYSHWQEGNGEDTSHIQVHFEPDSFNEMSKRCSSLSTILRNLSFVPGNDVEMSKHAGLLLVLGRLLIRNYDEDVMPNETDTLPNEKHLLNLLREDTLVIISNISSSLDLSPYNDKINLSLLDGLLHWACCSTSYALDPLPAPSMCSPQRLALESLAKLSIIEGNVDLILATPPWSRIEKLFQVLIRLLNINEDQTIREFSLVLLSNLTSADSGIARKVALTGAAIPRLLSFLETSITDPETFSTTQDMLRRAAITLKCLSQLVDNHSLFGLHQQRLLDLAMSQKLDPEVVPIIADVIFEISLSD